MFFMFQHNESKYEVRITNNKKNSESNKKSKEIT